MRSLRRSASGMRATTRQRLTTSRGWRSVAASRDSPASLLSRVQAFDYAAPTSVAAAVALLAASGGRARPLIGGTDLIAQLKEGRRQVERVVDLKRIPELQAVAIDRTGAARIGATVTCHRLNRHEAFRAAFPAVFDSTGLIGGIQIQGRASLVGNLCNASPSADGVPTLIVHGVQVTLAGPGGERVVPVAEFCVGPGRTLVRDGELVTALEFPAAPPGFGAAYLRFIPRNEMDIAVASAGVSVVIDAADGRCLSARIALGGVAPVPLDVPAAAALLVGRPLTEAAFAEAAETAAAAARPIDDHRGTVPQRRHLARILTLRALRIALDRARGTRTVDSLGRLPAHAA
jgi:CO/xanthine dehydrogenase FAD-binding subunit